VNFGGFETNLGSLSSSPSPADLAAARDHVAVSIALAVAATLAHQSARTRAQDVPARHVAETREASQSRRNLATFPAASPWTVPSRVRSETAVRAATRAPTRVTATTKKFNDPKITHFRLILV
jgi:hypothetical protein